METLTFDVLIIGAGPAGLACCIQLAKLAKQQQKTLSIGLLEKGAEIGAHTLSGAVIEPRALDELIPDWKTKNTPCFIQATQDHFLFLTQTQAIPLPTPPQMKNNGNYIISLSNLNRFLAKQAEDLGVQLFPGFAASKILYNKNNQVIGVQTNPVGTDKNGNPTSNYQPGINLQASYTVFAEGSRGSLTKQLFEKFHLTEKSDPQTYGLGLKEIWEILPDKHHPGKIVHTIGFPLDSKTYGGSFIYHLGDHKIAIGFVVGLDYQNPYLSPFEEFQRFKQHPKIRSLLEGGKRLEYGARCLNEGGFQSIPQLIVPGGLLIGCGAGFLNVPKLKGIHTAMKSGMLAAQAILNGLNNQTPNLLSEYPKALKKSWIYQELKQVRNIRAYFQWGLWAGLLGSAIDTYLFQNHTPWTIHYKKPDHTTLIKKHQAKKRHYLKPDNQVSFDRLSSLALSGTNHRANQPCHLILKSKHQAIAYNLAQYDAPEQYYCPAQVYEIIHLNHQTPYLQINAQNCLHCKACDIKDPTQNITWRPPEGGGGPHYHNM